MAQKVNPIALRLQKTNVNFDSCWYNNSNYVNLLMADIKIQKYIDSILKKVKFSSARFLIQNLHNKCKINVFFCNQSQKDMSRVLRVRTFKKLNKPDKNFFTTKNVLIKTKQNKIYNYLNKNFSFSFIKENKKNIYNTKKFINNCKTAQLLKKSKYLQFLSKQKNKSVFFKNKKENKYLCNFNLPIHESRVSSLSLKNENHTYNFEKYINAIEKLNEISIKYFIIKFFAFQQKNFLENKQFSYTVNRVFFNDCLFFPFFFKKNLLVSLVIHTIWNSYNTCLFVAKNKNNCKHVNEKTINTQHSLQNLKVNLKYLVPKYYKTSEYKYSCFSKNHVISEYFFLNTVFSTFKTCFTFKKPLPFLKVKLLPFPFPLEKEKEKTKEKHTKYSAFQKNSVKIHTLIQLSYLKRKLNFPFTIFTYFFNLTFHKKKENSKFPKLFLKTKALNFIFCFFDAKNFKAKSFANVSVMFKQYEIQKPNYLFYNDKAKSFVSKHIFSSFSRNQKKQTSFLPLEKQIIPLKSCLVQSPVYKQHIECILYENFKRCVSLQFFKSINMFQSALFLIDVIIYYLQKKVGFFKLKNFILRKLVEEKALKIKGIRIMCSGRVGGKSKKAQKAKIQNIKYGETSLHVFSYKIDFQAKTAFTSFGALGIKVWICYA